jgi:hypothetical protein
MEKTIVLNRPPGNSNDNNCTSARALYHDVNLSDYGSGSAYRLAYRRLWKSSTRPSLLSSLHVHTNWNLCSDTMKVLHGNKNLSWCRSNSITQQEVNNCEVYLKKRHKCMQQCTCSLTFQFVGHIHTSGAQQSCSQFSFANKQVVAQEYSVSLSCPRNIYKGGKAATLQHLCLKKTNHQWDRQKFTGWLDYTVEPLITDTLINEHLQ